MSKRSNRSCTRRNSRSLRFERLSARRLLAADCCHNPVMAEDVDDDQAVTLQDAFLVFLRNLDAIIRRSNGNLSFRGYLVRSARNHAYDELRRRRRADRTITARANDPLFRASDFADTSEDTSDEVHKISANLRLLPKEQREAVVLRALTDLTFREIAQLVGAPENTIVSRYRYGLSKLREQLGAHCGSTTVGTLGSCHERNAKS